MSRGEDALDLFRRSLVTGAALVLPVLVTVVVLAFAWNFVAGLLQPLVAVLDASPAFSSASGTTLDVLAAALLVVVMLAVGLVAERRDGETPLAATVKQFVAAIPVVGTVYTSARQMSEVVIESDADSFQDVKLVEFPVEGVYMLAFLTAEPHEAVAEAVGADMTLFLPLAPNPVMGGFLINVAEDRVVDVDVSVEEGVSSIVTSGVATGETDGEASEGVPSMHEIRERVEEQVEGEVLDPGEWTRRGRGKE
jgi:uncharacterized membrane protein